MNLNLRHLEAFAAVARLRSFTKAARALHVSQPSFTVQMKQLEEELGVRLLDRNTRSVSLTQIGHELVPVVERLLREIEGIVASTRALCSRSIGSVSIAALPSVSSTLLPAVIAEFRQQFPGVGFRLRDAVGNRIIDLVTSDAVDFGVGSVDKENVEIQFTPLFTDSMSAIFPETSPLRRKKSITLRELASESLILTDPESTVRHIVDHAFALLGTPVIPVPRSHIHGYGNWHGEGRIGHCHIAVFRPGIGGIAFTEGDTNQQRRLEANGRHHPTAASQFVSCGCCIPGLSSRCPTSA